MPPYGAVVFFFASVLGEFMSNDIVITSAVRTAVGSFNGALSSLPAHALAAECIKAALDRSRLAANDVSEVVLGQVLAAGQGMGPARQAAIAAGISLHEKPPMR